MTQEGLLFSIDIMRGGKREKLIISSSGRLLIWRGSQKKKVALLDGAFDRSRQHALTKTGGTRPVERERVDRYFFDG